MFKRRRLSGKYPTLQNYFRARYQALRGVTIGAQLYLAEQGQVKKAPPKLEARQFILVVLLSYITPETTETTIHSE